jgi:hypothetical protein
MRKDKIVIPYYDFQPFCVLEGGSGLNDCERYLVKSLNHYNVDNWVIDDLYDKPRRLGAVQFLTPKTLVMGTTGVYRDKLNQLIDLFFSLEITGLENIILTLDSEDVFWFEMGEIKKRIPNIKFWGLYSVPSMFDDEGTKYEIYEIER